MSTPPDRSHILTEHRNPRSMSIHRVSAAACVEIIQREDREVLIALERARPSIVRLIEAAEPRFNAGGRLIYLGAGTSGRLGVLDASEAPPTFNVPHDRVIGIIAGGDAALRRSSEGAEDDRHGARATLDSLRLTPTDTVIGIAAGGTTPYVLGAIETASAAGTLTALIVCAPCTPPPGCDHLILIETGPEIITGSTRMKAGTATKLALNTISTTLMIRSGRVYENLMVDLRATNDKLRDRAARIVSTLTGLDRNGALDLLDRASGEVKCAVVMSRLGLSADEARARLIAARGRLDALIDSQAVTPPPESAG